MSESSYKVNLSPHTATINLAAFYNSVRLDAGKRIGLFDGGLVYFVTNQNYNLYSSTLVLRSNRGPATTVIKDKHFLHNT